MFILPALLYLKVLPLFGQCLYHLIVPNKSRPPHAGGAALPGPLPALHPSWVGRAAYRHSVLELSTIATLEVSDWTSESYITMLCCLFTSDHALTDSFK
ncbi:hypothetical protein AVEN_125875-1 [Araneus ventricosus]|uniref:Uncharacterized protein n=1 Tax=Araneus ventricosus TaxID=182803 RepID=A0A4Y2F6G2_ARAVE|nr:hypothetical protein AVEN_125875-1 [Araneus ventricosus]